MNSNKIERKKKLHKYMNLLKPKRRSQDLTYTLKHEEEAIDKKNILSNQVKYLEGENQPIWEDPDDETNINLEDKNISKKFIKGETMISQSEYSKRTKQFYTSKQQQHFTSWAVQGEAGQENEENNIFEQEFQMLTTKQTTLQYIGRAGYKHNSVISDICWTRQALFTVGLDKVFSITSFKNNENDGFLKTSNTKHFKNLPLTKCVESNNRIFIGTLRKNYCVYDCNKDTVQLYSSTYLSDHKTYGNLRANQNILSIFSNKLISIFSIDNQFIGQLQTNQNVTDVCIQGHDIVATTKSSIYRWDNRSNKILEVVHTGLNNTSVSIIPHNDTLLVGTFSGVIYNHRLNPSMKQIVKQIPNLTTSVTGIIHDKSGNLIVAYSKWKKNALRVIQIPTQTVLQNWPSVTTKLNFPTASNFSQNSQYLAVGSSNGNTNIYKVIN